MDRRTDRGAKPARLKAQWRERLKRDVAEYLAGGGQIHRYTARDNQGYHIEKLSRKARIAFLKRLPMEQGPGAAS